MTRSIVTSDSRFLATRVKSLGNLLGSGSATMSSFQATLPGKPSCCLTVQQTQHLHRLAVQAFPEADRNDRLYGRHPADRDGVSGGKPCEGCIRPLASTRNRKRRLRRHGHLVGRPTSHSNRPASRRNTIARVAKGADQHKGCAPPGSKERCIHREKLHDRADRVDFDGEPKFSVA